MAFYVDQSKKYTNGDHELNRNWLGPMVESLRMNQAVRLNHPNPVHPAPPQQHRPAHAQPKSPGAANSFRAKRPMYTPSIRRDKSAMGSDNDYEADDETDGGSVSQFSNSNFSSPQLSQRSFEDQSGSGTEESLGPDTPEEPFASLPPTSPVSTKHRIWFPPVLTSPRAPTGSDFGGTNGTSDRRQRDPIEATGSTKTNKRDRHVRFVSPPQTSTSSQEGEMESGSGSSLDEYSVAPAFNWDDSRRVLNERHSTSSPEPPMNSLDLELGDPMDQDTPLGRYSLLSSDSGAGMPVNSEPTTPDNLATPRPTLKQTSPESLARVIEEIKHMDLTEFISIPPGAIRKTNGSFADVYQGIDSRTGKHVAVKCIRDVIEDVKDWDIVSILIFCWMNVESLT